MIRKIVTVLILIPLALAIAVSAVSNRAPVALAFDPLGREPPMFTASVPLYLALLVVLILGVIVGGIAAWSAQRKWRRRARRASAELKAAHTELSILRKQLEAARPGTQPPTSVAAIAYRHSSAA
jgi:uncharacterized integral membrane protein